MKLAVILPAYNAENFLTECLDSLLNQTFSDFCILAVNDASTDNTGDILESYVTKDARLRVYHLPQNQGEPAVMQFAMDMLNYMNVEYVARMDADDICDLCRFERQIEYLHEHPDIECLGTFAVEINSKGEEYYRKQMPVTHEECKELFRKRDCMIHPTVMFRRSYIEKAGLYSLDTYFGEDTMMWAQGFAAGCKFGNIPEYLYRFRLDDNFFNRRRGWKHAKNIFLLRHRVNKMLHFGLSADLWALAYACAKMMPTFILNIIYKKARKL